jgi:hypothetical protein
VSVHDPATQSVSVHTPLWQSEAAPQCFPTPHRPHVPTGPPQSTSDSFPFFTPSGHAGALQMAGTTDVSHTRLVQSPPIRHFLPSAQFLQTVPPQSTSVSPLLGSSVALLHAGSWQIVETHELFWQSVFTPQLWPIAHLVVHEPPQSTSVSVPFLTVSLHTGTWQVFDVHTPLLQSTAPVQALLSSHLPQFGPPQSMSDSP